MSAVTQATIITTTNALSGTRVYAKAIEDSPISMDDQKMI